MQWQSLAPRARALFYVQAFASFVIFWVPASLTVGMVATSMASLTVGMALGIGLAALRLVIALWMPSLAWSRWAFGLRDTDLLVAHGVLFRTITALPTQRIQHVDVRQGPIEQAFGQAKVHIYTASGQGADAVIPGLELARAEGLRDTLVAVGGDDGV